MKRMTQIFAAALLTAASFMNGCGKITQEEEPLQIEINHPPNTVIQSDCQSGSAVTEEHQILIQDVPYISQETLPTGCEIASAVMLLQNYGYAVSLEDFADNAIDTGNLYESDGILLGPSPYDKFIGSPYSTSGYGCYAPVLVDAMNHMLNSGDTAYDLTGTQLDDILTSYIDNGIPVAIWATINMMEPEEGTSWQITETGEPFTWIKHEHCLVLVGYDDMFYYFNDPYANKGLCSYSRTLTEKRYEALGMQAAVIVK